MQNVVNFQADRPRPPRFFAVPRSGARILFFTGVRYCRDEAHAPTLPDAAGLRHPGDSGPRLDAAAH